MLSLGSGASSTAILLEQNALLRGILEKRSIIELNGREVGKELEPTISQIQGQKVSRS